MAERFGRPTDPNASSTSGGEDDEDTDSLPPQTSSRAGGSAGSGGSERIDSQVQKAQEQLLNLRRQQEQIEKQKRELEELSRRQEELEQGRGEMGEKLTRALVVLDRQTTEAQKRVEQLRSTADSFTSHLRTLESINPKAWASNDMQKELSRALSMVDHARSEYNQQKAPPRHGRRRHRRRQRRPDPQRIGYIRRRVRRRRSYIYVLAQGGTAFTLPLTILGFLALAVAFFWHSNS